MGTKMFLENLRRSSYLRDQGDGVCIILNGS